MSAGQLPPPGTVLRKYDRNGAVRCEAVVAENGQVVYRGVTYSSISAAARVAASDIGLAARSCDGYAFFGLKSRDGGAAPRAPRPAQLAAVSLPLPLSVRWEDLPFAAVFDHSEHGRADASGAPRDPNCICRGGGNEVACAEAGCGFCRAARMAKDRAEFDAATRDACGYAPAPVESTPAATGQDGGSSSIPVCRCMKCGYATSIGFGYKVDPCIDGGKHDWKDFQNGESAADLEAIKKLVAQRAPSTIADAPKRHRWDADGERCLDCGAKDWMRGACGGPPATVVAPLAPASPEVQRADGSGVLVPHEAATLALEQYQKEALLASREATQDRVAEEEAPVATLTFETDPPRAVLTLPASPEVDAVLEELRASVGAEQGESAPAQTEAAPSAAIDVSEMRAELLAEIDALLQGTAYWRGGRLDTVKYLLARAEQTAAEAAPAPPAPPLGLIASTLNHRDMLGQRVREVWVAWAREQPAPKPSWLLPWEELPEPDREVDRRIGEALFKAGMDAATLAAGIDRGQAPEGPLAAPAGSAEGVAQPHREAQVDGSRSPSSEELEMAHEDHEKQMGRD